VVERILAWPLGKEFRGINRQCHRLDLHCLYATPRPAARINTAITVLSQTLCLCSCLVLNLVWPKARA
jgi:hypothetical protein